MKAGHVTLVGAGPGDPELLTRRAIRALRQASVVLADDLVADGVLRYVRKGARIVRCGKRGGTVSTQQGFINAMLIAEAARGERVVRLKGGDPFVFGRGGEEVSALRAAGIACTVVPGVTAGIAAPAQLGIPVTDRRCAQGVMFVTGHTQPGAPGPDWRQLALAARGGITLVVYMGMARCAEIAAALLTGGLRGDTPAAVIENGCTPEQQAHVTDLGALADDVQRLGLGAPAVVVIGHVVRATQAPCTEAGENADASEPRAQVLGCG